MQCGQKTKLRSLGSSVKLFFHSGWICYVAVSCGEVLEAISSNWTKAFLQLRRNTTERLRWFECVFYWKMSQIRESCIMDVIDFNDEFQCNICFAKNHCVRHAVCEQYLANLLWQHVALRIIVTDKRSWQQ